jgi:[ribosomal protein S5]-alanine N-acetyltransferase
VNNPPETLETARLRLRKAVLKDAEAIFRSYARDAEATRYVSWRSHYTVNQTRKFLRACVIGWKERKALHWAITRKDNRQLIGMISARVDGHKWELGYVLARPHWGQGYMTEAVEKVVDWALKQPEIYRVWAVCDVDNLGSARVMAKAGMTREGILRRWSVHPNVSSEPRDSFCYSVSKPVKRSRLQGRRRGRLQKETKAAKISL